MADAVPELPKRPSTLATARPSNPSPAAAIRQRIPQRRTSGQNLNGSFSPPPSRPQPNLDRRRSSMLSYSSIDEVAQSFKDDFINPSTSKARTSREEDEVTHWHSTPLAFALLPAIGGLFFQNGTAFITDILLLGLAAIFMNWSIRLPWDWYYSAQMQRRASDIEDLPSLDEFETDETAVDSPPSTSDGSPKHEPQSEVEDDGRPLSKRDFEREQAAAELRRQEKLALLSTFLFPAIAAYLIHVIRGQLSTPSTGLVSDFNLSIFLLAAEIRPCRQLIRLVTNRTLHLQRTIPGLNDPFSPSNGLTAVSTLTARVAELEAKLSEHTILPQNISVAQKNDVSDLSAEMRKRYDSRIEGLERAMRRYEKRSTTLAMMTDQRMGQLDALLQDTLSLAAQAARQSQDRGPFAKVLEAISSLFALPMKLVWGLVTWPVYMVEMVYDQISRILFGSTAAKSHKRSTSKQTGWTKDERVKSMAKKPAR